MRMAQQAWWVATALGALLLAISLPGYALSFQGQDPFTAGLEPANGCLILRGLTSLFTALLCLGLAILLFQRKRDDPMALFLSFYLLTYGIILAGPLEHMETVFPGVYGVAVSIIQPVFFLAPTLWLAILFPDGRPVPAWTRRLIPLSLLALVLVLIVDTEATSALNTLPSQVLWASWLVFFVVARGAQIHRYRRVSSEIERQRTRWVVFGLMPWLVLMMLQSIPYLYLLNLPAGAEVPPWAAASGFLWFLFLAVVPVMLTISILRHRLYDIDLLINRGLVYGALTAILAGQYAASINLFQRLFIAVTGQKSDAAIVLTTLVLSSAFTPMRARLQAAVDRGFKDPQDTHKRLDDLVEELRRGMWVVSPAQASRRLLEVAVAAFGSQGGALYMDGHGRRRLAHKA